mgnify:CR=1 FL=1
MTQHHRKVHYPEPVMIHSPNYFILQCNCIILVYFLSDNIHFTLVSLEAQKSGFEVVLVNDARPHGRGKSQLIQSNSLQKELSNHIRFAHVVLSQVSGP